MADTVSDEDLLEFLYQAPVGLIQLEPNGDVTFMTPKAIQLLLPVAQDTELENIFDVLSRVAPELRNTVMEFTRKRGTIIEGQRCAVHGPDGKILFVLEVTITKLGPQRLIMSVNDITRLVRKEREAMLGSQMIDSIVRNIQGQKVCVLDEEGFIKTWNASGERLNGYTAENIVGKHFSWLVEIPDGFDPATAPPADMMTDYTPASEWPELLATARRDGVVKVTSRHQRKDGTFFWGDSTISVLRDVEAKPSGFLVVTRDITDEYKRVLSLEKLASTDPLTSALNRRAFFERANSQAKILADTDSTYAVVMIDLDHFKNLNDTFGHAAGDRVLKTVAEVCMNSIRNDDVFARYGGEEFVLFLAGADPERAVAISERIRAAIAETTVICDTRTIRATASLGVARHIEGLSLNDVLKNADKALYAAKNAGRDRTVMYQKAA